MRRTQVVRVVIAVALTALVATSTASAKLVTRTTTAKLAAGGTVSATVSYTPRSYYDSGAVLSITRNGQQLLTGPVKSKACASYCSVQAIHATDIQHDGEPVILLDLFTGGAHCCFLTDFYTYSASSQTYVPYEHEWGDPGYRLINRGGKTIFETDDDRFAEAFTDYASSGFPIQYLSFNGTALVNVTRDYPKAIAADAARYLRAYKATAKAHYADSVGVIAAWAADEDELGRSATVARFLNAEAKAGHLKTGIPGYGANARFVSHLNRYLRKTGYLH